MLHSSAHRGTDSVDRDLAHLGLLLLGQTQVKHPILHLGMTTFHGHCLWQLNPALKIAVIALYKQHTFSVLFMRILLLSLNRQHSPI